MSYGKSRRLFIPAMSTSVIPFLDDLTEEFIARDFEPVLFPQNGDVAAEARSTSKYSERYHLDLVEHTPTRSLEALTDKYDIPSARSFVFPQMIYEYPNSDPEGFQSDEPGTRYPAVTSMSKPHEYEPFVRWLHVCLDYFDELYESGEGGHPVQFQGGEIIRGAVERVSDVHGYVSSWMGFSPIPGKSGFYTDETSTWDSLSRASYDSLSESEIEKAKQYISEFRESKPTVRSDQSGTIPSIPRTIANGATQLIRRGLGDRPEIQWQLKRKLKRSVMSRYALHKYLSPEDSLDKIRDHDYIFYPLQYYLESRVAVRAPAFYEQSWLTEYLSRSVPVGHELVVKDHPQQLGAQPRRAVDTMSQYSIPVSPMIDAHEVIQESSAVVVLNNTVGYEALLYGKPVVTLGNAFYDEYASAVDDINKLDETITEAIDNGGLSESEIIEFVSGLLAGSHSGMWRDSSPENVQNIVDGYLTALETT